MTLEEYRLDFLDTVISLSEASYCDKEEVFTELAADIVVDYNFIQDFHSAHFDGVGRRNKRIAVDGYSVDDMDGSIALLITDFDGGQISSVITKTQAHACFDRLKNFVEEAIAGSLSVFVNAGMAASGLVSILKEQKVETRKYKLILLTDKLISERIDRIEDTTSESGMVFEYNIWDIGRFYRVSGMSGEREELVINLTEYLPNGLPTVCVDGNSEGTMRSWLCPIPASVLADLYDRYGGRLLEGNVRSFLSTKRAVNKKIRETIITAPGNFFAFNNGISAIARQVVVQKTSSGQYITYISGLQIVNGGQTTASLATARYKRETDLTGIHVPMKLTCVDEEIASTMIPQISRSSNSQNKVSDADFFSNHEFHVRMEQISRRILAPSVHGAQFDTYWYYERATGQYQQETAYMTNAEKMKFLRQNPKDQIIKKIDLARVQMLWKEYPHIVAYGTQKNFVKFADIISKEWECDNTRFNEQYYKETVALVIIYKNLESLVEHQPWYVKGGYRAAYVTYAISLLHHAIGRNYKQKYELDLMKIWDRQKLPSQLIALLPDIARSVSTILLGERPIENVTEWAKRELCWERMMSLSVDFPTDMHAVMIDRNDFKATQNTARAVQTMDNGINDQITVSNLGAEYWAAVLKWPKVRMLTMDERSLIAKTVTTLRSGQVPTEYQCKKLLVLDERLRAEGFAV